MVYTDYFNKDFLHWDFIWSLDLQLPMQSVPITTNFVSLNPDTTLCDKVCQLYVAGRWFSPDTPVSSTNKTDRHDITEILLKVVLKTPYLSLSLHGNVLFPPRRPCFSYQISFTLINYIVGWPVLRPRGDTFKNFLVFFWQMGLWALTMWIF